MTLNYEQQLAIRDFLNGLSLSYKWDIKYLFHIFRSYELEDLEDDYELSYSTYIRTLKKIPPKVKRDLICKILNSWVYGGSKRPIDLYETLLRILYLKIETGVECVIFNNILKLSQFIESPISFINAEIIDDCYTITVNYKTASATMFTSSQDDEPMVTLLLDYDLLHKKSKFDSRPTQEVLVNLYHQLSNNFVKKHLPWVYFTCELYTSEIYALSQPVTLSLLYKNIEYVDNNGE